MKCPFCDNELVEVPDTNLRYCHQNDHRYEWMFDAFDGVHEVLKIDDKIYFRDDHQRQWRFNEDNPSGN